MNTTHSNSPTFTSGSLARAAGYSDARVRQLANSGELPHVRASDGTRLFGPDALAILMSRKRGR